MPVQHRPPPCVIILLQPKSAWLPIGHKAFTFQQWLCNSFRFMQEGWMILMMEFVSIFWTEDLHFVWKNNSTLLHHLNLITWTINRSYLNTHISPNVTCLSYIFPDFFLFPCGFHEIAEPVPWVRFDVISFHLYQISLIPRQLLSWHICSYLDQSHSA